MSVELMKGLKNIDYTTTPDTPYMQARQEWDNRVGTSIIQAKNWRLISFGLLLIVLILLLGFILLVNKAENVPYVIEVANGEVKQVAKAQQQNYVPTEAQLQHHLIKFVEKIRSVSLDQEVNKKWIFEAYAMLTTKTANKLDRYFTDLHNNSNAFTDNQTTFVTVNSFTPVTQNTYQLRWQEEKHDKNGKPLGISKWVGFATIQISTPTSEQSVLQNPLGIWITDFSWSQDKENI